MRIRRVLPAIVGHRVTVYADSTAAEPDHARTRTFSYADHRDPLAAAVAYYRSEQGDPVRPRAHVVLVYLWT